MSVIKSAIRALLGMFHLSLSIRGEFSLPEVINQFF